MDASDTEEMSMGRPHAWYSALVVATAGAIAAAAYPRLPDRVAVHWNLSGEADRWGTPMEAAWLLPAVMVAVWLVTRALPTIDPRRASYAKMRSTYDFVVSAILTMILAMHVLVLAAALGYEVPIRRVVPVLLGGFFIAFGNVLPRTRPNWWFGVRTPWTLSSDRVWTRTHRVAGYAMTATGVVVVLAAVLPGRWPMVVALSVAVIAAFFMVIYSYIAWRQETHT
jgi:uncharacterized membrane protein